MKLVLVEWIDSHSGRGWRGMSEIEECAELLHCRSIGWLVKQTKEVIVLVAHVSGEKNGDIGLCGQGDVSIPMKAVRKVHWLKCPPP